MEITYWMWRILFLNWLEKFENAALVVEESVSVCVCGIKFQHNERCVIIVDVWMPHNRQLKDFVRIPLKTHILLKICMLFKVLPLKVVKWMQKCSGHGHSISTLKFQNEGEGGGGGGSGRLTRMQNGTSLWTLYKVSFNGGRGSMRRLSLWLGRDSSIPPLEEKFCILDSNDVLVA